MTMAELAIMTISYNWYEWLVRLEIGHTRPGQPIWTSLSIPSGMLGYWSHVGCYQQ